MRERSFCASVSGRSRLRRGERGGGKEESDLSSVIDVRGDLTIIEKG